MNVTDTRHYDCLSRGKNIEAAIGVNPGATDDRHPTRPF